MAVRTKKVIKFGKVMECEREYYIDRLEKLMNNIKSLGYDCFLVYGGLLASMREKNLIAHDKDIDLAIVSKADNNNYDTLKKEIDWIASQIDNPRKIHSPRKRDEWGHLRFTTWSNDEGKMVDNLIFDVYLSFEDPLNKDHQAIYNWYPRNHDNNGKIEKRHYTSIPKEWIFPLRKLGKLTGKKFMTPNMPERCLDIWYEDWHKINSSYFKPQKLRYIKENENKRIMDMKNEYSDSVNV